METDIKPDKMNTFEDVLERVGTTGSYNVLVIIACAAGEFGTT